MSDRPAADPHATTGAMHGRRSTLRTFLLVAIGLLYLASIPWYWAAAAAPPLWFGLPSWVTVAVGCYFAAACLNAVAWWVTPISDSIEGSPEGDHTPDDGKAVGDDR